MRKKAALYFLILVFICISIFTGCNDAKTTFKESTKSENKDIELKLQNCINGYVKYAQFNGSVLVARNGDILLNKGYGMADFSKKIKNNPNTVYEIGSLTKQFTSVAILMLQEKGKLNINDKINKYLPDYPDGDKISIYNLLTHTSGIEDYTSVVPNNPNKIYSPNDIIAIFKNLAMHFQPGTQFEYSNSNYILLGSIIEKVSGLKYEDFISENILKPLGMSNSGFDYNKKFKNLAVGYTSLNPAPKAAIPFNMSAAYSAGGMHSTTEDLYKWNQALYNEKLINKNSLEQMDTPFLNNYGLGVATSDDGNGNKIIWHDGKVNGFTSFLAWNIINNNTYIIVILSNVESEHDMDQDRINQELAHELCQILYPKK